ncbi:MAG TPA: thiamine phosphate synthase [Vicinamibacterales bacterium]
MKLPRLNAIVDVDVAERAGWRPIDLAHAYLAGGARFLQLRGKTLSGERFMALARAIAAAARERDALFVVNDRADLATLAGADGVHVGQEDLSVAAVRRIVGDTAIVGLSTHTPEQLDGALEEPVSYVALGPVFGTATKATGYDAVGLARVRQAATRAGRVPLVAIGGISLDTAESVLEAGAASVAVIGDLLVTGDPASRVREYCVRLDR